MFRIDPHTLYSREDLARELDGLMDVQTFLDGINCRKRYRKGYWGGDLIAALDGPLPGEPGTEVVPRDAKHVLERVAISGEDHQP